MTKTKIIFMGTPQFAATVLKGLIDSNQYEILAVVTQPDRKVGRKQELRMTPVKELALTVNLPVLQPEKLSGSVEMTQIMALLESGEVGIVTAAFGQFLPGKLLDAAQFAVNTHASLLPKYRGGAPIHYAIMNGEKEAGVTIMEMIRKMDAGDMIAQASTPILEEDNVGTMFEKLALVGRDLLLETLPKYLTGELSPQAQNEDEVTFSPNISSEEEKIDWNQSAREIFNKVRGMNPFPVAHTTWNGERFKIYETKVSENITDSSVSDLQPGQVVEKTKKVLKVVTGKGVLELLLVQPAGKPKMDVVSFLNGLGQKLQVGDKFGE
ncbi:methionyl-tRNA formyltransferase [Lactococcus taiwanensis]|uniref:Methionyl-tRNA formyltransferase n=1 Tax=Lactococcus taiwanensis TaxID=1151742 RepID=A0AA45KFU3_9LACT|nr:methionyl-tRNA formyltransferase [Lactococcus taiwanensis]QSE76565.1 methionyl-tRNA formyltransferase [Lactococcus taiwanensis]